MQLVFAESIASADSGKLLIDTVLVFLESRILSALSTLFLGKIIFPAGCQKMAAVFVSSILRFPQMYPAVFRY